MPVIYWSIRGRDHPSDFIGLTELSGKGIDLEKPREVAFVLFVRTEASAQFLAERLSSEGFSTHSQPGKVEVLSRRGNSSTIEEGFFVVASKSVVLYGDTLRVLRRRLTAFAERENGVYLGWHADDSSH